MDHLLLLLLLLQEWRKQQQTNFSVSIYRPLNHKMLIPISFFVYKTEERAEMGQFIQIHGSLI
jgi:hypothetical protein